MSIAVATLDASALLDFTTRLFAESRGDIWEFHPRSSDALVRRVSRDRTLWDAAIRRTTTNATPDEQASWPGILRRAGSLTPAVRDFCFVEIQRQRQMLVPQFGMDVNVGRIRPVRRALLDVLTPLG